MLYYTLVQLSDLLDHVTTQVVIRGEKPLEDEGISILDDLPECEAMDLETGKILRWLDLEKMRYIQFCRELSNDDRQLLHLNIEKYHQQEVKFSKEFLGL